MNKESAYVDSTKENNNMSNSVNSNFSFNNAFNISANNNLNPYAPNNSDEVNNNTKTDKKMYLSANDFKNGSSYNNNDKLKMNKSLENPVSPQVKLEEGSFKTYEIPKEVIINNNASESKVLNAYPEINQEKTLEKYSQEIDQMIKETLEKAGLPYQTNLNNNNNIINKCNEPLVSDKYYSSSGPYYESNLANTNIPKPAYQNFSNSYHAAASKFTSENIIQKEEKPLIMPSYDSLNQKDFGILNDSGYPNYVNAVATNEMSTNNNLYNEQITFKDDLSINGSTVNLFNTNNSKENNIYTTNQTLNNYTFENIKTDENLEKKDLAAPAAPQAKTEEKVLENLSNSSNQQFKASEAITSKSDNENIKKAEGAAAAKQQNYNSIAISNLKKNEDLTFASNQNRSAARIPESSRESAKAKNKNKESLEKKEDYVTTQTSITNFQKEYLSEEDLQNLQFELGKTYSKDLCGEQINIISKYLEIGKVLSSMLPGILNNVNPVNRMDAFKILISNVHDWPNDESYFNGVICFLPTANQKEAGDIVKRMNRSNCCCTVF